MSKRPYLIVDLSSDDEGDDDVLLNDTATVLRKKSSPPSSLVTPTNEGYRTPLGTVTLPFFFTDRTVVGQEIKLMIEDKGGTKNIRTENQEGQILLSFASPEITNKLIPVLQHSKLSLSATPIDSNSLSIVVSAKSNRFLTNFESAPLIAYLQRWFGGCFTKIRKVTPIKAESSSTDNEVVVATPISSTVMKQPDSVASEPRVNSAANSSLVLFSPTASSSDREAQSNIRINANTALPYTLEQEQMVRHILQSVHLGYYAVLNLTQETSYADIKLAYRTTARKLHPDKNNAPNSKKAFQIFSEAYSILSDPDQRKDYDLEMSRRANQTAAASRSFSTAMSSGSKSSDVPPAFDPFEIFNNFFGGDVDSEAAVQVEMQEPDWENQQHALEHMFDEQLASQTADLPNYPMPPELVHVRLFDHQITGIRWLIHQERRQEIPSWFTQETAFKWRDKITGTEFSRRPSIIRGGILADDMGLGKTIQTLALILSNPPAGQQGYPFVPARSPNISEGSRCTIILCPLSVIANWTLQIKRYLNRHGHPELLRVGVYHGTRRKNMAELIKRNKYDIILTSYHTLASEYYRYIGEEDNNKKMPKKAKAITNEIFLFDFWFHRIILDEAHIIRNSKTDIFRAVSKLGSTYKLCLTGTPFVNRPDDIQSLMSFLGALPLADHRVFKKYVTDKIQQRKEVGMKVLRVAVAHVTLRRRKELVAHNVKLVRRTVKVVGIDFKENPHKDVYDILYQSVRAIVEKIFTFGEGAVVKNFMYFIGLVLRLRQSTCHASLIPPECTELAHGMLDEIKKRVVQDLRLEEAEELLDRLRGVFGGTEQLQECCVCFEAFSEDTAMVLRTCNHIFCAPCLNQITNSCCPLCRVPYTPDDMISKTAATAATKKCKATGGAKVKHDSIGPSPKLQTLFELIDKMAPEEKGVIFSQWTSMLDIVQREMELLGHTFTRIDGSMNAEQRMEAMELFDTVGCDSMRTPRFVLCSLHACGLGINLDRGNVGFMLDPWWNFAAENQAMNRIHRISSTRDVRFYRLVMNDTLEYRMLALQDAKEMLGKGSMERLSRAEKRKARLTQLRDLFELPETLEKDWDKY